ncbi:putative dsRNA-binding protein [Methanoregula sp.]|uniref:ribonuclease III family protein n=1 Tax=Methanoregula sp. TaxID=2052170 RepID=UPI002373A4C2|nr:putative dsRNA-binding protein [Methanoregula sp.]MDD1687414.1 putative dsRNA-binding protein [Methanoregula sp.]
MNGQAGRSLIELLRSPDPDVNRIVSTFVTRFNAAYGHPGTDRWDISKEDWQRYEFLGDRVLNLVVAQALFTQRDVVLDEGEMTRILSGIVSNRALDTLTRQYGSAIVTRLIPRVIGEQETYGERITGGAFEAFIGALYCEAGFDDVAYFLTTILAETISHPELDENAIGHLQEYFQKRYKTVPAYRQVARTGPDHKPVFTCEVLFNNEILGTGSGDSIRKAQQEAARRALACLKKDGKIDSGNGA